MLLHFEHEVAGHVADRRIADAQRRENRRQRAGAELDVNDVAEHLIDSSWSGLTHKR
jgi:hypothetical protein